LVLVFPIQPVWLIFPRILSNEFKTEGGTVHLYLSNYNTNLGLVRSVVRSQAPVLQRIVEISAPVATLVIEGSDKVISVHDIKRVACVKPGEKIPVDGKITDGNHYRRIDDFG
jgi:Cu2+-exporting ATPase